MEQPKYKVLIDDLSAAENMDFEIATVLIKALFNTYHYMSISIEEMDRIGVIEEPYKK